MGQYHTPSLFPTLLNNGHNAMVLGDSLAVGILFPREFIVFSTPPLPLHHLTAVMRVKSTLWEFQVPIRWAMLQPPQRMLKEESVESCPSARVDSEPQRRGEGEENTVHSKDPYCASHWHLLPVASPEYFEKL